MHNAHALTLFEAARFVFPNVILFDGARYLFATLLFALIGWVVMRTPWAHKKIQARQATRSDMTREVLASMRSVLIYAAVFTPLLWATSNGFTAQRLTGATAVTVAAYVVVLLLAHDTWFYWTHRLLHDRRLFKRWHRTHHRSITPTPFAAYAFDGREALVQVAFFALWNLIVPTPTLSLFLVLGISILRNAWGHLGIELHPVWFADHWFWGRFTTTTHHDLHHDGGFGTNYGLYFTWWDRVMGTEHPQYRTIFRAIAGRRQPLNAVTA